VVPLTRRDRGNPFDVPLVPPEDGLRLPSFALCESIRSVSTEGFRFHRGALSATAMSLIEERLRILLDLN
jgi:mRNA interferase MazF